MAVWNWLGAIAAVLVVVAVLLAVIQRIRGRLELTAFIDTALGGAAFLLIALALALRGRGESESLWEALDGVGSVALMVFFAWHAVFRKRVHQREMERVLESGRAGARGE